MATQLQIRRGTAAQVAAFTGAEGEIVYNSTNDSLHTNDGSTAGGFELARVDGSNFALTSAISTTANFSFGDNDKAIFGAGSDLQIYHDGSNSYITDAGTGSLIVEGTNLILRADDGSRYLQGVDGTSGVTRLYHPVDDAIKLSTTSTGIDVTGEITADGIALGDSQKATFGASDDLQIYHDGGNSIIRDVGTGDLRVQGANLQLLSSNGKKYLYGVQDAYTKLYYDNAEKLATTATGIDVTGVITTDGLTTSADINFGDSDKAIFGAGSDLQIYHDGSNSYIRDTGTGNLNISADQLRVLNAGNNEIKAGFTTDGAVDLYHNNALKLSTTSTGINVTGTATMDGLTVDGNALVAGTTGVVVDNGTITTGKDSASSRTHWSMNNPNGEVAKWDSNGTDLLHFITDEYKVYTAGNKAFEIDGNGDISFYEDTGTTPKFFWDASAESLGIGTSAPAAPLDVNGSIYSRSGGVFADEFKAYSGALTTYGSNTSSLHYFKGSVGIGTNSPDTLVEIVGADPVLTIRDTETAGASTNATLRLAESGASDTLNGYWDINYTGLGALAFKTKYGSSLTERMRIDSSGKVGIGTASPNAALAVVSPAASTLGSWVQADNYGLRVSAGSTSAHYALRIANSSDTTLATFNGDGNVGIGTASPVTDLHVTDGGTPPAISNTYLIAATSASNAGIAINAGSSSASIIALGDSDSQDVGVIRYDHSDNSMRFNTASTERMRIDSSGVTTFKYNTKVYTGGYPETRLGITDSNYFNFTFDNPSDALSIGKNGSTKMTLTASGRVGIGTSSPAKKLEIAASNQALAENNTLRFTDTDTTSQTNQLFGKIEFNSLDSDAASPNRAYILSAAENSLTPSYIAFGTAPHTSAATERMRIDSSGRVGIGTSSPAGKLDVLAGGDQRLLFTTLGTDPFIGAVNAANSAYKMLQLNGSEMRLMTGGAERMRIDSNGSVLVGTTTTNIAVEGTVLYGGGNKGVMQLSSTNKPALYVNRSNAGELVQFRSNGTTTVGSIGTQSGNFNVGRADKSIQFHQTLGVIPWNQTTNGATDNALNLGYSGARFKDAYLSGGIYLGGTGAANKLDDYESGSWTPIDSSGASLTFSTAIGTYVKVGKLVTLSYSVTYPSTADTTDMKIGGLPFTPDASFKYAGSQSYTTSSAAAASTVTNVGAYIIYRTEGGSDTINNDQLSSDPLRGSLTYEV